MLFGFESVSSIIVLFVPTLTYRLGPVTVEGHTCSMVQHLLDLFHSIRLNCLLFAIYTVAALWHVSRLRFLWGHISRQLRLNTGREMVYLKVTRREATSTKYIICPSFLAYVLYDS